MVGDSLINTFGVKEEGQKQTVYCVFHADLNIRFASSSEHT
jgi:hypothetical protein